MMEDLMKEYETDEFRQAVRDYNLYSVQPTIVFEDRAFPDFELKGIKRGHLRGFWDLTNEQELFIGIPNNPTLHSARLKDVIEQEGKHVVLTGNEKVVEYTFMDYFKKYRKGWLLGTINVKYFNEVYKILDQNTRMLLYVPKEDVIFDGGKKKKHKWFEFWKKDK